jgi:hypothetical protein
VDKPLDDDMQTITADVHSWYSSYYEIVDIIVMLQFFSEKAASESCACPCFARFFLRGNEVVCCVLLE